MKQGKIVRRSFGTIILMGILVGMLLQACTTSGPTYKDAEEAAQQNALLGSKLLQDGKLAQARDKLEKALKQDKKNALAHLTYGQLQHVVENPKSARIHFNKAIELEPEQASHRNSYGVFLCQVKDYAAAEKQFGEAATNKFYETPEYSWDNAGVCMLDSNQLDKAEGYLRKALQINPKFANPYLHMAELLYKRDRLTVAEAYYDRFRHYGDDTPSSLLLGIQINRDTGKTAEAEQYATKLLNNFPASSEAGEYLSRPLQ